MKIKTFNSVVDVFDVVSESTLDNDVNKWIKEIDPIIADIKYSISGNKHYGAISTILIIYEEKNRKPHSKHGEKNKNI